MSSLSAVLSKNNIKVLKYEKTIFSDGTEKSSPIAYLPVKILKKFKKNNRFRPKHDLSDEEHSKLLRNQNAQSFAALTESLQKFPCFEAVKIHFHNGEFVVIDGNRRLEASIESGREDFLGIIYEGLSDEQLEFVTEWNEENPTKLPHDLFYRSAGIAIPIIEAKSDEEREKAIQRMQRRKIKLPEIEKAVTTHLYIADFAKRSKSEDQIWKDQYKAFETVALINKNTYQPLRETADFDKIQKLENLEIEYLKAGLAHDDIKVALDGLAKRSMCHPLWAAINSKEIDITKTFDLRRIVNEIRLNNSSQDLVGETRTFSQRLYGKILSNPSETLISDIKLEVAALLEKLNILEVTARGAM